MISMNLIIQLLVAGLIFYICWWALGAIAPPEPINKILRVILVVLIAVFCINLLLGLMGGPRLFRY